MPRNLIYCDVGARWGIGDPWKSFRDLLELLRFEPDKEEYESLMKNKGANDMIYQYALYREPKNISLNLTKSRGCSSLYKPNHDFLKNYADSKRFKIEDVVTIRATSLDALYKDMVFSNMDFIKIDVQGAELDILREEKPFYANMLSVSKLKLNFSQCIRNNHCSQMLMPI